MCGIAGIYAFQNAIGGHHIYDITNAIRHRGPDDAGYALYMPRNRELSLYHCKDSVAKIGDDVLSLEPRKEVLLLGHRRLSIVDVSPAGHQPMLYDNGNLMIVFNGEIYNYIEIRAELISKGYIFSTKTDTEVVLASYKEWGYECLSRFNGMWGFVILDLKKNILFGSRDRFGVKPLYYRFSNGLFAFASEIKALLTIDPNDNKVNEGTLFDYLTWGSIEHFEETFFRNIKKLPHSHYFTFDFSSGKMAIKRYYQLNYNRELGVFDQKKYDRHCLTIKDLFTNAVKLRLRSDVPVGTCLSGGLDSSSIAVTVNDGIRQTCLSQVGDRQKVFTACYGDHDVDESRYAKLVVDKTNAEWFKVFPKADELFADLESLVYTQDEPFSTTSIYAQFRVMKLTKENKVKVLLDGQGGDELFAGYNPFYAASFLDMLKHMRIREILSEMRSIDNSPTKLKDVLATSLKYIGASILSGDMMLRAKRCLMPEVGYINSDFHRNFASRSDAIEGIASFSINDLGYKLMAHNSLEALLRYEDRNSMAHSIEARTPFSDDLDLIEYVFSIPSIYKIRNGWSKALLRSSLGTILPEEIKKRRGKLGFAVPERKWYLALKESIFDIFREDDQYIDTEKIRRNFDELIFRSPTNIVWRFINVILWRRVFNV